MHNNLGNLPGGEDGGTVGKGYTFFEHLALRKFTTVRFLVSLFLLFLGVVVYIISRLSTSFAEFWTRYPAFWIKAFLGKITGIFSFSVAELGIVSLIFLVIWYFLASSAALKKYESEDAEFTYEEVIKSQWRWHRPPIYIIIYFLTVFLLAFGPCYFRNDLPTNLGLEQRKSSAQELYDTAVIITDEMDDVLDEVFFPYGESTVLPYTYDELVDKINAAYRSYCEKHDYISTFTSYPKPIALSELYTYTHISGVYTFPTGEANINTNYPDFLMPFTMAHEMAHQRGIAKEDEANFVAYLICLESDDPYIRYSAYANLLSYVESALASDDYSLYSDYYINHFPTEIISERRAYSTFFDKYRSSTASKVVSKVNDIYLGSQGQSEGTKSYGLVVDLAIAYYLS